MADRFHGKVVIVTGAASGIGEATARRFVAEGAKVALVDRDEASLEKVAKSLPADQVMVQAADVSDSRAVDGLVAAIIGHFGRLDVIVNNAGVHEGGDPASITDEKWRKVMSTDVDGVFYGCRAALPHIEKTRGSIVNSISLRDWGRLGHEPLQRGEGRRGQSDACPCPRSRQEGHPRERGLSQSHPYGHDGRHDERQESAGEVRRADPVRPGLRTGGSRRRDRVSRKRRCELHDWRQRSGGRGCIRLQWTTTARVAAQRRSSSYLRAPCRRSERDADLGHLTGPRIAQRLHNSEIFG